MKRDKLTVNTAGRIRSSAQHIVDAIPEMVNILHNRHPNGIAHSVTGAVYISPLIHFFLGKRR
ncbi:MAG: hypothetical protein BWY07_00621 [Candidatus Hydrogenedentes bacterium ADurb.Bin170]|nr:MAG: hypothetical protein BWY07_00621 [Candidatus Hydrogenedentes bacterium ADurb.Bin170]